jgi:hypothetical protein
LNPGTTCTNSAGTLALSTASNPAIATSCSNTPGADVWYSFTATNGYPTISLSGIGSALSSAGVSVQLFSGTCGALTSLACVSGNSATLSLNIFNSNTVPGLTLGSVYYMRVYTPAATPSGSNWNFNICITNPNPGTANATFSKSYINVTKGTDGGTVDIGDTLEMRATFVVTANMVDSLSFTDTLYSNNGLRLVPGSISLRTNEGKVYKSLTDAFDSDGGMAYASGQDTVVRINFGTAATAFNRGRLTNTSKPSVFTSTCIVMATYRAVVYAGYDTRINFKTGTLSYRDLTSTTVNNITFKSNNLIVYRSPGLCPNAVSASNAVGAESNGTFGVPVGTVPLARNRGTTPSTTYTYNIFSTAGGPQDLQYGITNNTSASFTTINTWGKPSTPYRVFSQWDIIGDHTGATNTASGNPACDTTRPVSATNPCGYMLVINSAYKTDTAFQYTATNLCPNTYYEISAWLRNICYKCGCDSNGTGSGSVGYIPTAANDSSGVRPNIAFDVNGTDYYTTGDILYYGTTPTGSDANNRWVKRGFTYLTGPSETSFTLTLRNNAPGGGGNDWAMDDISIATCLPNMTYSPTTSPTTCQNNPVVVQDTIRSYFNNYMHYKWQRSTNGGTTWTDIAGEAGSETPVLSNSEWQYITTYTIPPSQTGAANNGDRYRVTVATTASNLANSDCQFTDGISIINLTVNNNCTVLPVSILTFNGKLVNEHATLYWTTSQAEEPVQYSIERSTDGNRFTRIGLVSSNNDNRYAFTDTAVLVGRAWYRIALINEQNKMVYSRSIILNRTPNVFTLTNGANPFTSNLTFDVTLNKDAKITATLYSLSGTVAKQQSYAAYNGTNGFTLADLKPLPQGVYILQVQCGDKIKTTKVVKR